MGTLCTSTCHFGNIRTSVGCNGSHVGFVVVAGKRWTIEKPWHISMFYLIKER